MSTTEQRTKRKPIMHKAQLLEILCQTLCPVCNREKNAYLWTCSDCYRPHSETPEHKALSDLCDAHMLAADAFIYLAREHQREPHGAD